VDEYYEDRFRADDTFWTSEEATSGVWVGMYSLLCRRLGIADEAEDLARAVYDEFGKSDRWRAYDDVAPAFRRMRALGIKVGIISNWDRRLEGLFEAVGLHKPDPRIFELACSRLDAEPEDCAHIGDHFYSDILGARAAGLRPVMIDRKGGGCVASVTVIGSLDEIEGALDL
jgi:putative hydrolase of the HAD superfamily